MNRMLISVLLMSMLILPGCQSGSSNTTGSTSSRPFVVVTSFYPLYVTALNVTLDVPGVELVNMTPPSTTGCLHDYQLTPEDLKTLHRADAFIVNGAGMESFLDKVVKELPDLKIISAAEGFLLLKDSDGEENPHIWVSIDGAIAETKTITAGLASLDASRADLYRQNQNAYVSKLESLRDEMKKGLSDLDDRNIVTFHEAFPYFARDFNLNIVAVLQEEPDSEPSPQDIREIVDKIRATRTRVLFTEPQYPGTSAQVIARETGAQIFELDPAVTGPADADAYINIMKKNLQTLKEALQ